MNQNKNNRHLSKYSSRKRVDFFFRTNSRVTALKSVSRSRFGNIPFAASKFALNGEFVLTRAFFFFFFYTAKANVTRSVSRLTALYNFKTKSKQKKKRWGGDKKNIKRRLKKKNEEKLR